jgi:hypothetical protein
MQHGLPLKELFLGRVCVYYCRTSYKAVCVGRGGILGDMCYEAIMAIPYTG